LKDGVEGAEYTVVLNFGSSPNCGSSCVTCQEESTVMLGVAVYDSDVVCVNAKYSPHSAVTGNLLR
jgi:hypothetical protein